MVLIIGEPDPGGKVSPVVGPVDVGEAAVDFDVGPRPKEGPRLQALVGGCVPDLHTHNNRSLGKHSRCAVQC